MKISVLIYIHINILGLKLESLGMRVRGTLQGGLVKYWGWGVAQERSDVDIDVELWAAPDQS